MDNILPFLADLCGRLNYTPTAAEMEDLSKSSMIEMRIFFEAPALGISDAELFDKIMVYYRLRAKGEKSKFKLTDPLTDADRKLSKPAAPIKAAAPAAAKPVVKNEIPAAMKTAEADRRTYNKTIDVIIQPGTGSFAINVTNRNTSSIYLQFDFTESQMIKLTTEKPNTLIEPLVLEATVEANGRVVVGRVVPSSLTAPISISYRLYTMNKPGGNRTEATCTAGAAAAGSSSGTTPPPMPAAKFTAARPAEVAPVSVAPARQTQAAPVESKPAAAPAAAVVSQAPPTAPPAAQKAKAGSVSDDEEEPQTERKNLGDNLDMVIDNDGSHGYIISVENKDSREYLCVLDMSASINLVVKPKGSFVTIEGHTATFTVKPKSTLAVLDMPVDNFDLQMCELRYKASIRKQ